MRIGLAGFGALCIPTEVQPVGGTCPTPSVPTTWDGQGLSEPRYFRAGGKCPFFSCLRNGAAHVT